MLKFPDLSENAPWKQRFRASTTIAIEIAAANPGRGLVCSDQSGLYQLYTWDLVEDRIQQLTNHSTGISRGRIAANGNFIYYLDDQKGNELGHYVRVPFEGGKAVDITPAFPPYAGNGITESPNGDLLGLVITDRQGFHCYLLDKTPSGELNSPNLLWESTARAFVPKFSQDSRLAAIATNQRSGQNAFNVLVLDTANGKVIGELWQSESSVQPIRFSPHINDQRLLVSTDVSGFERPLLWHPVTGEQQTLAIEALEGNIAAWDWSIQDEILLCQTFQAQEYLYLLNLHTGELKSICPKSGTFSGGQCLPNGNVIVSFTNSSYRTRTLEIEPKVPPDITQARLPIESIPVSEPWRSVTFPSTDGTLIQAWLALPSSEPPYPTILHVHGGPTSVVTDCFSANTQAWLDHGYAWLSVNYRGSVTFGKAFERAIWENLGNLEVEDMVAARNWLLQAGLAEPHRILVIGGSYGGYLTLQALGKYPDLWAGGMAEVAIADWFLMYEDQAETLRACQRSLFGGTPDEKLEAHQTASPITYAEHVKAPILVIQGRNDTRCPARQMEAYEAKLKSLGKSIQIHWFDAGHGSKATEQQIEHQALQLQFAYSLLAGAD
ncbi:prolyl oligopeptidase family serine peptidase [Trichocoleus desertorum AS-A10]|uniref:prolyl oligopeptidase family serine peptidase n=1 Tax=Trichocoleus desertorum TaxID=1481672 RepID=UPI0032988286